MKKQTLSQVQESAGFYEPNERINLGGLFNGLFFFSILDSSATVHQPQGKLKESIDKYFTDFEGFKESFKKSVQSRFVPGWIWLGVLKDGSGKLVIS